jgi:hypothetical protein
MSAGSHRHEAFKNHRLTGVSRNVVTLESEIDNPDGSTVTTTINPRAESAERVETTVAGGLLDCGHLMLGARCVPIRSPRTIMRRKLARAFEPPVIALQNLGRYGAPVEIRVVVHAHRRAPAGAGCVHLSRRDVLPIM